MSSLPVTGRLDAMKIMNRRTVLVATTLGALLGVTMPGTLAFAAPVPAPAAASGPPPPALVRTGVAVVRAAGPAPSTRPPSSRR